MASKPIVIALIIYVLFERHFIGHSAANVRQPRTLLFPPTSPTRIQFIGGIGIPVENLIYESITSGYVLKAEYFLPTEAHEWQKTYLRPQTIHRRSLNETNLLLQQHEDNLEYQRNESTKFNVNKLNQQWNKSIIPPYPASSLYRWIIYQAIEQLLQRTDRPGRQCMLRSICEHAAVPLHIGSGILAEMLHIILSPSSSKESLPKADYNVYYKAEGLGRMRGFEICAHVYRGCRQSPMDDISAIFSID